MEIIGGTNYTFDSNDCTLMFKKFRSVYGPEVFGTFLANLLSFGPSVEWPKLFLGIAINKKNRNLLHCQVICYVDGKVCCAGSRIPRESIH